MGLYLTYEEYCNMSLQEIDEGVFNVLEKKAHYFIDYITYQRIPTVIATTHTVPDSVKDVMVEYINRLNSALNSSSQSGNGDVTSYSNGVEKLTYQIKSEKQVESEMASLACQYLPNYLTARSVEFDVKKYLQPANNNTQ